MSASNDITSLQNQAPTHTALSQQWRDLRDKWNRKVLKKFEMPFMKSKELDIILEVLNLLQPRNCLEWGSGYSTLLLPKEVSSLTSWHSIEHYFDWYTFVTQQNKNPQVEVHWVAPDNLQYDFQKEESPKKKEGTAGDFHSYIHFPETLGKAFDFIFIDGRARKECLKKSYDLLTDDGVVIVHDANRTAYFDDLPPFLDIIHLKDYRQHRNVGGIWIGVKRGEISRILDVDKHRKLWYTHEQLAKYLFLK
jgi:hypothetical protein